MCGSGGWALGPLLEVPGHWLWNCLGALAGVWVPPSDGWMTGLMAASGLHVATFPASTMSDASCTSPQRDSDPCVLHALAFSRFVLDREGAWSPCNISQWGESGPATAPLKVLCCLKPVLVQTAAVLLLECSLCSDKAGAGSLG